MRTRTRPSLFLLFHIVMIGLLSGTASGSDIDRIAGLSSQRDGAADYARYLSVTIGGRAGASEGAARACRWAEKEFKRIGLKGVHLEECGRLESDEYGGMIFNVVGDIPGIEYPDEYVLVGAHIDCVPVGAGATDNASGVGAVMEAARLLVEAGVRPKRTIRFVLFGGEEVGLVGSRAYVRDHADLMPKISAVYNMDMGSNYISGIEVTSPMMEDMSRVFGPVESGDGKYSFVIEQVEYLPDVNLDCGAAGAVAGSDSAGTQGGRFVSCVGAAQCGTAPAGDDAPPVPLTEVKVVDSSGDTLTLKLGLPAGMDESMIQSIVESLDIDALSRQRKERLAGGGAGTMTSTARMVIGSSDHAPFLGAGVPAFTWEQNGDPGFPYPLHSEGDTFDAVDPEYLQRSAFVISAAALGTADLDGMISRQRLMRL